MNVTLCLPALLHPPPSSPLSKQLVCLCVLCAWCAQVYLTLLFQWAYYWLWAVYLSNVLPNEVRGKIGGAAHCCTCMAHVEHLVQSVAACLL